MKKSNFWPFFTTCDVFFALKNQKFENSRTTFLDHPMSYLHTINGLSSYYTVLIKCISLNFQFKVQSDPILRNTAFFHHKRCIIDRKIQSYKKFLYTTWKAPKGLLIYQELAFYLQQSSRKLKKRAIFGPILYKRKVLGKGAILVIPSGTFENIVRTRKLLLTNGKKRQEDNKIIFPIGSTCFFLPKIPPIP